MNGQAAWHDNVQFSWRGEKFKFFTMIGTSSSSLSTEEWNVQQYPCDSGGDAAVADGTIIPFKMFTYHRLEEDSRQSMGSRKQLAARAHSPLLAPPQHLSAVNC